MLECVKCGSKTALIWVPGLVGIKNTYDETTKEITDTIQTKKKGLWTCGICYEKLKEAGPKGIILG